MSGRSLTSDTLARQYLVAKRAVIDAGYASEIGWQAEASSVGVTARSFTEHATWVVMSSGLAESVVRRRFPMVSKALFGFDLGRIAVESSCRDAALSVFRHEGKVDAILAIAAWAHAAGDDEVRVLVEARDEASLMELPFIGPATVRHLLKKLGAPVAKPDRHLVRFASRCGWPVDQLCATIPRGCASRSRSSTSFCGGGLPYTRVRAATSVMACLIRYPIARTALSRSGVA